MRYCVVLIIMLSSCFGKWALGQDCDYQSPVKGPIVSSGSYGEPRSAHFHAGIDFKQRRGVPYDTIYAIEEGYVSRVVVGPDGYGNALYINHPCGQTSVYAHLYEFAPMVADYVKKKMYELESYTLNHRVESPELYVKRGDFIGIMGSTGRSSGPHLHFEIRNTDSQKSINPALYNLKPPDDIFPIIRGIVIYTLTPDGQEMDAEYYPAFINAEGKFQLKNDIVSKGALIVGVGIHAYDMMNGANNHNGIYAAELKVDGDFQFRFKLDSLSFESSRHLHSHMDYEYKLKNRYVTKLFKNPGNPLNIYRTQTEAGNISLYTVRPRNIEIRVFDIDGNRAIINLAIVRSEEWDPLSRANQDLIRISPEDTVTFEAASTTLHFSPNTFATPVFIHPPRVTEDSILLKQEVEIPIFRPIRISKHMAQLKYPKQKYLLTSVNDKNESVAHRCNWEQDTTLICEINRFKNYNITIDTIAPVIEVISLPKVWRKEGAIMIKDNFNYPRSTDLQFKVMLNGVWQLCQHDGKSGKIWWQMDKAPQGNAYELEVYAEDLAGNQSKLVRKFTY